MREGCAAGGRIGFFGVAAAVTLVGCGGGSSTGPSASATPVPLASILTWDGTATYTEDLAPGHGNWKLSFTGPLTWRKDDKPPAELFIPPDHVTYRLASGQMHVTYSGVRTDVGCSDQATANLPLVPDDPEDDPSLRSFLSVGPDGRYGGRVYNTMTVSIGRTCPGYSGSFDGNLTMRLSIAGTLSADRRMQGNMRTETYATQTNNGSWDFTAR